MAVIKFSYLVSIFIFQYLLLCEHIDAKLPTERRCAGPLCDCETAISIGITTQRYDAREKGLLSFPIDAQATVYSKEASSNSLWEVMISDRKGFVPKRFIREQKVYVKFDKLIECPVEPSPPVEEHETVEDLKVSNEKVEFNIPQPLEKSISTNPFETVAVSDTSVKDTQAPSQNTDMVKENLQNTELPTTEKNGIELQTELAPNSEASQFLESSDSKEFLPEASKSNEFQESQSMPPNSETIKAEPAFSVGDGTSNGMDGGLHKEINSANEERDDLDKETLGGSNKIDPKYFGGDNAQDAIYAEPENQLAHSSHESYVTTVAPNNVKDDTKVTMAAAKEEQHSQSSATSGDAGEDALLKNPIESSYIEGSPDYEVVEGTTIYQSPESVPDAITSEASDPETTYLTHLQTSQKVDRDSTSSQTQPLNIGSISNTLKTSRQLVTENNFGIDEKIDQFNTDTTETSVQKDEKLEVDLNLQEESLESFLSKETIGHETSETVHSSNGDVKNIVNGKDYQLNNLIKATTIKNDEKEIVHFDGDTASSNEFSPPKIESLMENLSTQNSLEKTDINVSDTYPHDSYDAKILDSSTTEDDSVPNSKPETESQAQSAEFADLQFIDPESAASELEANDVTLNSDITNTSEHVQDKLDDNSIDQDSPLSSLTEQIIEATGPLMSDGMSLALEAEMVYPRLSSGSLTFLLIVAGTIVAIYFTHRIIAKMSQEAPLLEAMNNLARQYRIAREDNLNLKKQLTNSNGQIKSQLSTEEHERTQELQLELENLQVSFTSEMEETTDRIQQLEQELEESTVNGLDMHRMLDELLSEQKDASNFQASVDSLQAMLDGQRVKMESLTSDLTLKIRLNEELQLELKSSREKLSKLEHQIEQLTLSLEEINGGKQDALRKCAEEVSLLAALKHDYENLSSSFSESRKENENLSNVVDKFKENEKKLKLALRSKEAELKVSKECLRKIKLNSRDGKKLEEFLNVVNVRTELECLMKEKSDLTHQLKEAKREYSDASNSILRLHTEVELHKSSRDTSDQEREESKSKLEVLTRYFKEREAEYTKKLESQEGLRLGAEGSASAYANEMQNCQMELLSLRSQVDTLKTELEEQKQSYKLQLNNEEKKALDNWLSFRGAERRQEELRQENGQLRQRLTSLQQKENENKVLNSLPKRVEANGSVSSPVSGEGDTPPGLPMDLDGHFVHLPPMMPPMFPGGPPLPPGMHHPPPHQFLGPLPPLPPDRRLPPAGRMASPPFRRHRSPPGGYDRRSFSPSSDHSQYSDRYSPGGGPRSHSPDRRLQDRSRLYNSRSSRGDESPPPTGMGRCTPDRWYNRSPDGVRNPKNYYYDDIADYNRRPNDKSIKGTKTSTPLGPNDR